MKRLLIITYYWPPAGGGGVQRWLKHSKYLREAGWEPVIFTAEDAHYPVIDNSLQKELPDDLEVIKAPIWEPYELYKKFTGRKKRERVYSGFINENKKASFSQKLSVFIRGNFFIPDARCFWINPASRALINYLKEHPVKAMVSTGPPHTTHLIAEKVKKRYPNIKWVADFRDPWTQIDFYDQLNLTNWADRKHKRLEKKVLKKADKIVTVSWSWGKDFERLSRRNDIEIITNGYDEADFSNSENIDLDESFSIFHAGSMNKDRNVPVLWKALEALTEEVPEIKKYLKIVLVGQVDFSVLHSINEFGLEDYLDKRDFVPHSQVVQWLQSAQLLLLPINNTPNVAGVLPGKLYEYLGAKRPIICICPDFCDAKRIMEETQAGVTANYEDVEGLKAYLKGAFEEFKQKKLGVQAQKITQFSRRKLAERYGALLDHDF